MMCFHFCSVSYCRALLASSKLYLKVIDNGAKDDFQQALQILENRATGMINFVDGYRSFTSIPAPSFTAIDMDQIIQRVMNLLQPEMTAFYINFTYEKML